MTTPARPEGMLSRIFRRSARPTDDASAYGRIELVGADTRVVIVPTMGGRITHLETAGRQWLWSDPRATWREPVDRASTYQMFGDTGGWDECFPSIGACTIPTHVSKHGGTAVPDHGDLWRVRPEIVVATEEAGPIVRATWTGSTLPYRFEREVQVGAAGVVRVRYAVTNKGTTRLPFLWAAHMIFPLSRSTHLVLPEGARVRVASQDGIDLFGVGAEHRWPKFRVAKSVVDLSRPEHAGSRFAAKLFLDVATGRAALEEERSRLEFSFDAAEVPNIGVWVNRRGLAAASGQAPNVIGIEPGIGAPDTLSDALGSWDSAHWIEAGDTKRWSLELRGVKLDD